MLAYRSVIRIAVGGVIGLIIAMSYSVQLVAAITPLEQGFEAGRGVAQELLGQAIVDATRAQTVVERAKAQEALGRLIVTAARLDHMQEIQMVGAQKIPTTVVAAGNELRGEVPFWPLGALGALIFGYFIMGLQWRREAVMPAAEEEEEKEMPLRKAA